MTKSTEWFTFDAKKRAQRIQSFPLAHVLKELLSNGLDAEATSIQLTCQIVEGRRKDHAGNRTYQLDCIDNGRGCADPEILRRVGSTTSDENPTKRGRFGQGLIDVLAISEEAEILTHKHRLVFDSEGCRSSTTRTSVEGLRLTARIRHPGLELQELTSYFRSVILPDGIQFSFNETVVQSRVSIRIVPGIKLPTPIFDQVREVLKSRVRATELHILDKAGDAPMIYEMGIPVDEIRWSLPFDVNVMQKTPLDVDRVVLPDKYKDQVVAELVGPLSDLYAAHSREHGDVPHEIRDNPSNAQRLSPEAQSAVIEAHLKVPRHKLVRRNNLDKDDRSESQELEDAGYLPIRRNDLPDGLKELVKDVPTVAKAHDRVCKPSAKIDSDFPEETARQAACIHVYCEIAGILTGVVVRANRMRGGPLAAWSNGVLSARARITDPIRQLREPDLPPRWPGTAPLFLRGH